MSSVIYSGKNLPSKQDKDFQQLLSQIRQRPKRSFPYTRRITRANPTCFVFLIDQSGSMNETIEFHGEHVSKAEALASILNQSLNELIDRCKKGDEVRDYFHICLIGYGGDSDNTSKILWNNNLQGETFVTPSVMIKNFINEKEVEFRRPRPDGTERIIKKTVYEWIEPAASNTTPMRAAFELAHDVLVKWIAQHPESYPPTIINITDGQATDADEEELLNVVQKTKQLSTDDGEVIIFNIHISSEADNPIYFPCKKQELPNDKWAHLMFDMSSDLPEIYNQGIAKVTGKDLTGSYTALVVNAEMSRLISLLNIGTNTNPLENT